MTPEKGLLAGEKFTNNEQCELAVGPKSKICSYMPVCTRLWCTQVDVPEHEGGCATQHMPWADGTECGIGKWCQKGECINKDRRALRAIDGGWGNWTAYGPCSLTCGGGIQISTRECDNPKPSNSGKFCSGSRYRYISCNTEECPPDEPGIREKQCLSFNGKDQGTRLSNPIWVPKYEFTNGYSHYNDQCKLYCQALNTVHYFELSPKVIDGTPCTRDGTDKCIMGKCEPAGCDNVLGSSKILDRCGICGGMNDTCKDIYGFIRHDELHKFEHVRLYYNLAVIPKGATNILIQQPGCSEDLNLIALKDYKKNYILNSPNSMVYIKKTIPYGGINLEYNGGNANIEEVRSITFKTLKHPIYIELFQYRPMSEGCKNRTDNIITYSYSISTKELEQRSEHQRQLSYSPSPTVPLYQWKMSDWSQCDQLCQGKMNRTALCTEFHTGITVQSDLAHKYCTRTAKPTDDFQKCNTNCLLEWDTNKSECNVQCGEGLRQIQTTCVKKSIPDGKYNKVDPSYCRQDTKPAPLEKCQRECSVMWNYDEWSLCSKTCGLGVQTRNAHCIANDTKVDDKYCLIKYGKPEIRKYCNEVSCPEWVQKEYSPCTVTCGNGKRYSEFECRLNNIKVDSYKCGTYPRPIGSFINCSMPPCENQIEHFEDIQKTTPRDFSYTIHQLHRNLDRFQPTSSNEIDDVTYKWRTGPWGECSLSCNGGKKIRTVKCTAQYKTGEKYEYVNENKCSSPRPKHLVSCNNFRCPTWQMGLWSECNDNCKKERIVICQDHRGKISDECPKDQKPHSEENCCHIKWRSTWKPCSNSCGSGVRTREIVCMKLFKKSDTNPYPRRTAKIINSSFCSHMTKPTPKIMERECRSKRNCKFRWFYTPWAKCSVGCGLGYTTRSIYCSNGTINGTECNPKEKPNKYRKCESKSSCRWRTTKWRNCSCNGITKRRVICMDLLTNAQSNSCPEEERPLHRDRCTPPPNCSCKSIQIKRGIREDGEQFLNIRGRQVSIYCANMTSTHPKEYLTLRAGSKENYSIYYSKRTKDGSQCGDRSKEFDDPRLVGFFGSTRFERIRLDIHTLKVIDDDYTFSTSYGKNQKYATAGDCYNANKDCPQGDFSINLTGTKFRIRPKTQWDITGQDSAIQYVVKTYQKVRARCGGNCGSCAPSRITGLYLELVT